MNPKISLCNAHQRNSPETIGTYPRGCATCVRINVERAIVIKTINALLKAGYCLQFDSMATEAMEHGPTRDKQILMDAAMEVDDERLYVYSDMPKDNPTFVGWVYFVYGNDGWDVISDYTTNLDHVPEFKAINDWTAKQMV